MGVAIVLCVAVSIGAGISIARSDHFTRENAVYVVRADSGIPIMRPSAAPSPPQPHRLGGGYQGARWGMTMEQVRAVLPGTPAPSSSDSVALRTESGTASCYFHDGHLYSVSFRPSSDVQSQEGFQAVTELLTRRHGPGRAYSRASTIGTMLDEVQWADEDMSIRAMYTHIPPQMVARMRSVGMEPVLVVYEHTPTVVAIQAQEHNAEVQREEEERQRRRQRVQGGL